MSREVTVAASLARTALTDPAGLPTEEALTMPPPGWKTVPLTWYAVERLDEIINLLDPSEWTAENAAATVSVLGLHLRAAQEGIESIEPDPNGTRAAHALGDALDALDAALVYLGTEATAGA